MLPSSLAVLGQILDRRIESDEIINGISIDSRNIQKGDLFVALRAKRDGHNFIDSAKTNGAVAALTTREHAALPCLLVEDTGRAFTDLARAFRNDFLGQVFSITGSQGKTSTRGFLASVVREVDQSDYQVDPLVTEKNLNNQLGVPLTLSKLRSYHRSIILELGASTVGDIDHLASIARPHISCLLNARTAHLETFGSINRVIQGKGEIIDHTDSNGFVILNNDDPAFEQWYKRARNRQVVSFGRHNADVCWKPLTDRIVELRINDRVIEVTLPTLGKHFMENAAAACAMAIAARIDLKKIISGLSSAVIEPGRMTPLRFPGQMVVDDTYNASPQAVRSAIDWLSIQEGKTSLIMGGLSDLGDVATNEMLSLGQYAKASGIKQLIGIEAAGPICEGYGSTAYYFRTFSELEVCLDELLAPMHLILVKGSRSSRMERVVAAIKRRHGVH